MQQRLDEERASLLGQLELLERKKNEELQNLKTLLIAEQQVGDTGGVSIRATVDTHLDRSQSDTPDSAFLY